MTAGLIGAVANTLRLELVDLTTLPPAAAAFIAALVAGLIASLVNRYNGYPRISLTVHQLSSWYRDFISTGQFIISVSTK